MASDWVAEFLGRYDEQEVRLCAKGWVATSGWWRGEIELADQQVRNLS